MSDAGDTIDDADNILEIEAALDLETTDYRHQLGLMHPAALCKVLGVNRETLKRWRMADKGPAYIRVGNRVWYLFDDVRDWLEDTKHMPSENREQRRDYSKMTQHPDDVQKPGPKEGQPVDHPTDNPGGPGFDPDAPPPGTTVGGEPMTDPEGSPDAQKPRPPHGPQDGGAGGSVPGGYEQNQPEGEGGEGAGEAA